MKKILIVLLMILILSPFKVKAFKPIRYPGGIIVRSEECESNPDSSKYIFDILVRRDEVPLDRLSETFSESIEYYIGDNVTLDNEDLYLPDNEWISYSAYVLDDDIYNDDHIYPSNCSSVFEHQPYNIKDSVFSEFKVLVFRRDGELLLESEIVSTNIMLQMGKEDYQYIVYEESSNSISIVDVDYENWQFEYNYPGLSLILWVLQILMFFAILLFILVELLILLDSKAKYAVVAGILGLDVIMLALYLQYIFTSETLYRVICFLIIAVSMIMKYILSIKMGNAKFRFFVTVNIILMIVLFVMNILLY